MSGSRSSRMRRLSLTTVFLAISILSFSIASTGCGKNTETAKITKTTLKSMISTTAASTKTAVPSSAAAAKTATATLKATSSPASSNPFDILDDKLDKAGIYFQKTWMAAQMIGAAEGYKYATHNGTFELYSFDTNSEDYKTAVKNNAINLGGTLYAAVVKNGFAIYFYDNATAELRNTIKGMVFP
jgi:hypothetical protein